MLGNRVGKLRRYYPFIFHFAFILLLALAEQSTGKSKVLGKLYPISLSLLHIAGCFPSQGKVREFTLSFEKSGKSQVI